MCATRVQPLAANYETERNKDGAKTRQGEGSKHDPKSMAWRQFPPPPPKKTRNMHHVCTSCVRYVYIFSKKSNANLARHLPHLPPPPRKGNTSIQPTLAAGLGLTARCLASRGALLPVERGGGAVPAWRNCLRSRVHNCNLLRDNTTLYRSIYIFINWYI